MMRLRLVIVSICAVLALSGIADAGTPYILHFNPAQGPAGLNAWTLAMQSECPDCSVGRKYIDNGRAIVYVFCRESEPLNGAPDWAGVRVLGNSHSEVNNDKVAKGLYNQVGAVDENGDIIPVGGFFGVEMD